MVDFALGENVHPTTASEQVDRFVDRWLVDAIASDDGHNLSKPEKGTNRSISQAQGRVIVISSWSMTASVSLPVGFLRYLLG